MAKYLSLLATSTLFCTSLLGCEGHVSSPSPKVSASIGSSDGTPKTSNPVGKKLLATIGHSLSEVKSANPTLEGGFNAASEKNQSAVPFGASGFEFDMWTLKEDEKSEPSQGVYALGVQFYAYVYGDPSEIEIFKNFGMDISEWKKGDWTHVYDGKATKSGALYQCKGYSVGIDVRKDKQFTTIMIWKNK